MDQDTYGKVTKTQDTREHRVQSSGIGTTFHIATLAEAHQVTIYLCQIILRKILKVVLSLNKLCLMVAVIIFILIISEESHLLTISYKMFSILTDGFRDNGLNFCTSIKRKRATTHLL